MLGIIGKKLGMTQIFQDDGKLVPVTVVQAGPCTILQKKTEGKEKYSSLQLGFDEKRVKSTTNPLKGHFKKASTTPKKKLFEFRMKKEDMDGYQLGQTISFESIFKQGDFVDVIGTSKGRGFAGVMKRHGFHGSDVGHGTHEYKRHGGSIGQHTYPGRTFRGLKMPGQYGNTRVTTQSLKIAQVDKEHNLLLINGPVPGANGGFVVINKAVKKKPK